MRFVLYSNKKNNCYCEDSVCVVAWLFGLVGSLEGLVGWEKGDVML